MKKHIFFWGGGGRGRASAQFLQVMSIILDFIKKNQRRLDEVGSAMNVACFHPHFG